MTTNIKLTENFWLKEFFKDKQHPEVAARLFDECTPFQAVLAFELAQDQQYMRNFINDCSDDEKDISIINTSGHRDAALNGAQVGGAVSSLHLLMRAVDFKTENPTYLKYIYTNITSFSALNYRECFLYVTADGVPTNIHYAKNAPGYTDTRKGIYVRPRQGGKPIRTDRYLKTLSGAEAKEFKENLSMVI